MCPCAGILFMNGPVCSSDGFGFEHAVATLYLDILRKLILCIVSVYHSIDNRMDDVNALWTKLSANPCAKALTPAFDDAKAVKGGFALNEAVAPVKNTVPLP